MQNKSKLELKNVWICSVEDANVKPVFGDLIVNKNKIAEIIPKDYSEYINDTKKGKKEENDFGGRVVTLPNVNFHDHFYSRLAKGLPINGPMDNFLNILKSMWWKLDLVLDEEMIKASAQMSAMESIRNGVTYIFDHHASPFTVKNSLSIIADVLEESRLRGVLCFEISDRNGEVITAEEFDESVKFLEDRTNKDIQSLIGLHASFTLKEETLKKTRQITNQFNTGIHIHLCEDPVDTEITLKETQKTPLQRLNENNLLNIKSILGHGIHLSDDDYKVIQKNGSAIVYNPDSNLNNAVGLPEYSRVPKNIPILAGTDGMHANIASSLKQLFLLYRNQKNSGADTFEWFIKIYFDQLKFVKFFYPDFPSLQVDDRADFIVWDYVPPTPFGADNFWGHFIYGILERPVHSVIQNGNYLMKDFDILLEDEAKVNKSISKQGERFFTHFKAIDKPDTE